MQNGTSKEGKLICALSEKKYSIIKIAVKAIILRYLKPRLVLLLIRNKSSLPSSEKVVPNTVSMGSGIFLILNRRDASY